MEFDKNRVYTALNADELKVGSTVIVANDLWSLRGKVEEFDNSYEVTLSDIRSEAAIHRFKTSSGYAYLLAYLIEPPKELQYKPFSDSETAFKIINFHGGWVKDGDTYYLVVGINLIKGAVEIRIRDYWISAQYFFENFVFADDGTPAGDKIEDAAQSGIGG